MRQSRARPPSTPTRYRRVAVWTRDHATTSTEHTTAPAVIRPRGPRMSSQRPTGTAAAPVSRTAREKAPPSWAALRPSSAPIGTWNTEKA